jgi:NAD(P)-dependent dehydrogenase (short-subunit alcohol dehydrogenase family)
VTQISLDGKAVIVTGAGRGIGRSHALLLASRGAHVVVNDLGTAIDGSGTSQKEANAVVTEIRDSGGIAIANCDDISQPEGALSLIRQSLDAFGKIDTVVCNAGICQEKAFEDCSWQDVERYWQIHVGGHFHVIKAAWPTLKSQGQGRVICTSSGAGYFGQTGLSPYAMAKGAISGFMRTLAIEGKPHGILVNSICPGGFSRMQASSITDPESLAMLENTMPADLVSPVVVWLASDDCRETGQAFSAWGGRVSRLLVGSGEGLIDKQLTPEIIASNQEQVMSSRGLFEAKDGIDDVSHWLPFLLSTR